MSMRQNACLLLAAAVLMIGVVPMAQAQETKAPAATTQPAAGVTGTYSWTTEGPQGDMEFTFKLKQEGDKVTGTLAGFGDETEIQDGKIAQDGTIAFKVVREWGGREIVTNYTGKVTDGVFKGKSEMVMAREFEAKRVQE